MTVEVMQSQHSPDVLKSKAEELKAFALSVYGEPLNSLAPLGKRISLLPRKRLIGFRSNELKNVKDGTRNTAVWAQTRGSEATSPCSHCAAGCGPFSSCVVLKVDDQQYFEGSCANCHFNGGGTRCSFRISPATISPAELLREFQSAGAQKDQQETLWFKTRRATTEEPQASEKSRLDSPFPVTIDSTSRRSTLPATTNSTPRSSIAHEVKHRRTPTSSTTPTTTETDPVLTQPAKSKADGKVLKCPMTFSMYNDPSMLRDARDDLLNFLHLVENWLGEVEFDITLDVWGAAMTNLEKQERIV